MKKLKDNSVQCICPNNDCGEYNDICQVVDSITDFLGYGAILKKGNYEVDFTNNYQFEDNKFIAIASEDVTITIKNSKSIYSVYYTYDDLYQFRVSPVQVSSCANIPQFSSGKLIYFEYSTDSLSGNKLIIEADGDYGIGFDLPDEGSTTLKVGIDLTIKFKNTAKLSSFLVDRSNGDCSDLILSNYKSQPTIAIEGSLSNSDDIKDFVTVVEGTETTATTTTSSSSKDKLSKGALAGIIAGCVVVVAVIIIVAVVLSKKKKGGQIHSNNEEPNA